MPTSTPSPRVRPPAVAGSFYTASPDRLRAEVAGLLAEAPGYAGPRAKALIAPHAGYIYSGKVAATAFAALRDIAGTVTRVVVIGPAHYVALRGIAVPTADAFATPLGRVPVDRAALTALADLPFVVEADAPHAPEHALEVELPPCSGRSRWCRSWSALPRRRMWPRCWVGCGAAPRRWW